MRSISLVTVLFLICFGASAQSTIAKLKYEQAEEAFSKSEFRDALYKLDETEKLLGEVNPKILYLRIMAQAKLLDADTSMLSALKQNCTYYLKTYDGNSSLEEKYKEVYLVSETLLQYQRNPDFEAAYALFAKQQYAEALPLVKGAMAQGYARAYTLMGHMYRDGLGVTKDPEEAVKYYRRSAEKGNATGLFSLGQAYYFGNAVAQNYAEALNLFSQAAAKNFTPAIVGVADVYYFGLKDYANALAWYKKAAKTENTWAWSRIGMIHYFGQTGKVDYQEAFNWFLKAAEKGHPSSMNFLGVMYKSGYGMAVDKEKAAYWYTNAAEAGDYYAMGNLAAMLEQGDGIKKDKKAARAWREKQKTVQKY